MAEKALETYLNDHLGGATLGKDLAFQIRDRAEDPLRAVMDRVAPEIEEDRQTLMSVIEGLDATQNPVKQATGWVAEKASRMKFTGVSGEMDDYGLFMALEALRLGVAGKKCLWLALGSASKDPRLAGHDFDALAARADAQEMALEEQRMILGTRVLTPQAATA